MLLFCNNNMNNDLEKALYLIATTDIGLIKTAREKLKKAKEKANNTNDWCYSHDDKRVTDERDHFPIYDVYVASKTVAQLKGLDEIPNWWEGDNLDEFKSVGLNEVSSRWSGKIDVSKIKPQQVKKKPKHSP